MRRTRVAFYVTYLIIPQLSAQSTGNFLTSSTSDYVFFTACYWFFQSAGGSAKLHKYFLRPPPGPGSRQIDFTIFPARARSERSLSRATASVNRSVTPCNTSLDVDGPPTSNGAPNATLATFG